MRGSKKQKVGGKLERMKIIVMALGGELIKWRLKKMKTRVMERSERMKTGVMTLGEELIKWVRRGKRGWPITRKMRILGGHLEKQQIGSKIWEEWGRAKRANSLKSFHSLG